MAFQDTDLNAIYAEIRRRQSEAGRLSLVEFDDAEYDILLDWARRIVRGHVIWWSYEKRRHTRVIFLAFTMAFVRRNKYTADHVFWPDFEDVLGLSTMERRLSIMDDLLWPAYADEDIERGRDDRGRRIVGSLVDEMSQARTWVTQARGQFVAFFRWYYRHHPGEEVSSNMLVEYRRETGRRISVLDKVLPALSRDCQALARVIDYAIENDLYLRSARQYRTQVAAGLGPDYDPTHLRLIHDERSLVKLIRELQNHCTPAQFERELRRRRGGFVRAPWREQRSIHTALERWTPFPYGIYRVEGDEYRVVPHRRLRLEVLDEWPYEEVVHWRGERYLGYKKTAPFQVTVGRRTVEARRYVRSRGHRSYIWFGEVPTGQKFAIDGHLRPESAGADWDIALHLSPSGSDHFGLHIAITRLMLYYPDRSHQPVRVWSSTGYDYEDSLRADSVRRFHLHPRLIIPLDSFDGGTEVSVDVGDETVLHQDFEPKPHYLFSISSRERVRAREIADIGDREYVLFTRDGASPRCGPGVRSRRLPNAYGRYALYQITWDDPDRPFDLRIGSAHWTFRRRREFTAIIELEASYDHLRLKPRQCLRFQDLSLRLYSTSDLIASAPTLEVCGAEGLLGEVELASYLSPAESKHLFDVSPSVWERVETLVSGEYGRYVLRFCEGEALLGKETLSLIPSLNLKNWDSAMPHLATEPVTLTVASPDCPIWNPGEEQPENQATLQLHPKTQAEPWPDHPALRQITSEPISGLVSFPEFGETVEVVVRPWLFGFRLYLKRQERSNDGQSRTRYQPVSQADDYHLHETALYVFSAPHRCVEVAVGALTVVVEETDEHGNLLLESLACLRPACLSEKTSVTVRSGDLHAEFLVRWAPLLQDLKVEGEEVILRFNGPEDTAVRLWLRDAAGEVAWTRDVPCAGEEKRVRIPLPAQRPVVGHLTAGYVLADGSVRSAMAQVRVEGQAALRIPPEWLQAGVGVDSLEDVKIRG
jgi:hypothetical protein